MMYKTLPYKYITLLTANFVNHICKKNHKVTVIISYSAVFD